MKKLSKIRVAEDLKIYFLLMQYARSYPNEKIKDIYVKFLNFIRSENKDNSYDEIISVTISMNLINCIGIMRDELVDFLKRNIEINNELSFLDSCFINGSNPNNFNKIDVLVYIRNAFFHSDKKELYFFNDDGSVDINMPGISLFLHLSVEVLYMLCSFISKNTQRAFIYKIENQENINIAEIAKNEESCVRELRKIKIIRLQNKNKVNDTAEKIRSNFPQSEMIKISDFEDYAIDKSKKTETFEFYLSNEQCKSISKEITLLKKYFPPNSTEKLITIFLFSIIINNLEFGVFKCDRMLFEVLKINDFLCDGNETYLSMIEKINRDLIDFIEHKNISSDNFFKKYYCDYGKLNGDIYKRMYIYLYESKWPPYNELENYFSYMYTNLVDYEGVETEEHIRNAFTHKRFCWLKGENINESSIYFFDNNNDVRNPVSLSSAQWTQTIGVSEIIERLEQVFVEQTKKTIDF